MGICNLLGCLGHLPSTQTFSRTQRQTEHDPIGEYVLDFLLAQNLEHLDGHRHTEHERKREERNQCLTNAGVEEEATGGAAGQGRQCQIEFQCLPHRLAGDDGRLLPCALHMPVSCAPSPLHEEITSGKKSISA
jgi:hypothetical protein